MANIGREERVDVAGISGRFDIVLFYRVVDIVKMRWKVYNFNFLQWAGGALMILLLGLRLLCFIMSILELKLYSGQFSNCWRVISNFNRLIRIDESVNCTDVADRKFAINKYLKRTFNLRDLYTE